MKIDETDWASLNLGQRIRRFEVEGFVVLPGMLDAAQIERLKSELADVPMVGGSYSDRQTESDSPPSSL